jgi:hypothetical protein
VVRDQQGSNERDGDITHLCSDRPLVPSAAAPQRLETVSVEREGGREACSM